MTTTQRIGRALLFTTLAVLAVACGSSSSPQHTGTPDAGDPKALVRVVVTPAKVALSRNTHERLSATAVLADGTTQDVTSSATWSSATPSVATVSNDAGSQGRLDGIAPGTADVTARYQGQSDSAQVSVVEEELVSLVVSPGGASLPSGLTLPFTATGIYSDSSARDLTTEATWSSSDTNVASLDANKPGLFAALAHGIVTITATIGDVSASQQFTVNDAQLVSLVLSPASPSVPAGLSQTFTATGVFSDLSAHDVTALATWSSSDDALISVGGSPGTLVSHAVGTATITATFAGLTASQLLNVTAPVLEALELQADRTALLMGDFVQVHATGSFSDGTQSDVTDQVNWSSSDPTIFTVSGTSGSEGRVQSQQVGSAYAIASLGSFQELIQLEIKKVSNLFAGPVSYSTQGGGGAVGMDLLDVNHDGREDVLALVFASPRYYLNQGDGTLGAPQEIAHLSGYALSGSATGDLDGDGWDDLVLTADSQSDGSDHVLVFLNDRDGTFTLAHDLDPGAPGDDVLPADVTIADVDGDTFPDLVVGTGTGNVIDLYWGDAAASYSSRKELSLTAPESVAVADFDGDQIADLAVSSNEAAVVVLHNNGDRTFSQVSSTPVSIDFTPQIRAADLDRTGTMDLVVPSGVLGGGIWVLIGQGNGTFATPVNYPGNSGDTVALRLEDVNRDGNLDVLANDNQVGALIYYGAGDGTFSAVKSVPAPGYYPQGAEATDLNGDQLPELIVLSNSESNGNGLSVMRQIF